MTSVFGTYWFLALSLALAIAISTGTLFLLRRYIKHDVLAAHHDVAGYFLAVVGTLYGVVLGFIVVDALENFQKARVTVEQEANALHDVSHLSAALPAETRHKIQKLCRDYANTMITVEWRAMQAGQFCEQSHDIMLELWRTVITFQPQHANEQAAQSALLAQLTELGDNRHNRLLGATPTYDGIVWFVLITGGIATIVFTYFFGIERLSTQLLMTGLMALVLSLNLVLVAMFDYPYSGDVTVSSQPFLLDLQVFEKEHR